MNLEIICLWNVFNLKSISFFEDNQSEDNLSLNNKSLGNRLFLKDKSDDPDKVFEDVEKQRSCSLLIVFENFLCEQIMSFLGFIT